MTANENTPASVSVWYFVGATFVLALPMILLPDLPWWVRTASMAFGGALIVVGFIRLRREKSEKDRRRG